MMPSTSAASSTVRVSGPTWSMDHAAGKQPRGGAGGVDVVHGPRGGKAAAAREAPPRWSQTHGAAVGGGASHRTAGVLADRHRAQAGGGGDARARGRGTRGGRG